MQIVKVVTHWKCDRKGRRTFALGPRQWLGYMQKAKYVVTNSFHGICFSLALEKEVYIYALKGDRSFTNPRIYSIMDQFSLQDRELSKVNLEHLNTMDYAQINAVKAKWQDKSLQYLQQAIEGAIKE